MFHHVPNAVSEGKHSATTTINNYPPTTPLGAQKASTIVTTGPGRMLTSGENPNFVKDYFKQSRLHHMSSWYISEH